MAIIERRSRLGGGRPARHAFVHVHAARKDSPVRTIQTAQRMMFKRILAAALGLTSCLGCGTDDREAVYPVQGRLTYGGQPMDGAVVTFHPADTRQAVVRRAHGTADAQGEYRLTTYTRDDGAPMGEYVVTIYWPSPRTANSSAANPNDREDSVLPPDRLRGKYADPRAAHCARRWIRSPRGSILRCHDPAAVPTEGRHSP